MEDTAPPPAPILEPAPVPVVIAPAVPVPPAVVVPPVAAEPEPTATPSPSATPTPKPKPTKAAVTANQPSMVMKAEVQAAVAVATGSPLAVQALTVLILLGSGFVYFRFLGGQKLSRTAGPGK